MRWTSWFAGAAAVAFLGCSSSNEPDNGDDGNGGNGDTPDASVSVVNNAFNPPTTNITAGQSVRWTWNSGGTQHNVTFETGSSSPTQGSGSFDRTFDAAGTFDYQCTIHGSAMSGSVVVGQGSGNTGGNGNGNGDPDY